MDIMLQRILELIPQKHGSKKELADAVGIPSNLITDWKAGKNKSYPKYAAQIANFYSVSLDWLSGNSDEIKKPLTIGDELSDMTLVKFPVIGSIAAGYGCCAVEEYTGEYTYFSATELSAEPTEYFVLRVNGNSMYPKLLEGDCVLVRRKSCVDSGKIAVVLYDGEDATVKKVNFICGENWLELVPINPEYQSKLIEGTDLDQCRILGEVVKLQRDM